MPKKYYFYDKNSFDQEPIAVVLTSSRLKAAKYFANGKKLPLKSFLKIYSISR